MSFSNIPIHVINNDILPKLTLSDIYAYCLANKSHCSDKTWQQIGDQRYHDFIVYLNRYLKPNISRGKFYHDMGRFLYYLDEYLEIDPDSSFDSTFINIRRVGSEHPIFSTNNILIPRNEEYNYLITIIPLEDGEYSLHQYIAQLDDDYLADSKFIAEWDKTFSEYEVVIYLATLIILSLDIDPDITSGPVSSILKESFLDLIGNFIRRELQEQ